MYDDWIDLFVLFEKHDVRYLIIGGNAVVFHGFERYTKDIDIWVSTDAENAKGVYDALKIFGVLPSAIKRSDFEQPDNFVVLGAEPYRIDIIMGPPGMDFETAYNNRVIDSREKVALSYISCDDLIVLKKAAGRPRDARDVEMLQISKKIQGEPDPEIE